MCLQRAFSVVCFFGVSSEHCYWNIPLCWFTLKGSTALELIMPLKGQSSLKLALNVTFVTLCYILYHNTASINLISKNSQFSKFSSVNVLSLQYPACIMQIHHTTKRNTPTAIEKSWLLSEPLMYRLKNPDIWYLALW